MAETVYLHVGAPKTGTTFLQGVLWNNRETLFDRGIHVPGRGPLHHFRAGFDLRRLKQDPQDSQPPWTGAWDKLAREVVEKECRGVVVSDERLAACTTEEVQRAVQSLNTTAVHVIYTVRSPVHLLPAAWQEAVKHGDRRDFSQWMHFLGETKSQGNAWFWRVHSCSDVLKRWTSHVPAQSVYVITLPPPGSPRDLLWRRFAAVLQIEDAGIDLEVRGNSSVGEEGAELLRRVNEILPKDFPHRHRIRLVREVLAHAVLAPRMSKTPIRLPERYMTFAEQLSEEMTEAIRRSGCHLVGSLDDIVDGGLRDTIPDRGSVDISGAGADAVAGLIVRMSRMEETARETNRRLVRLRREANSANELRVELERTELSLQEARIRLKERECSIDELADKARKLEMQVGTFEKMSTWQFCKRRVVELSEHSPVVYSALSIWRRGRAFMSRIAQRSE